jgi:hypothetical protein
MDTHYNSKKIFCDSNNPHATGSNHMRKQFTLSSPIIIPPQSKVKMMIGVEAVSIPLSFYVFNDSNNKIRYSDTSTAIQTYELPKGNYSITTLKTEINADTSLPFNIDYNVRFAKIIIIPTVGGNPDFTIHAVDDNSYKLLGIVADTYVYTTEYPLMPNTLNLVYTSGVNICLNNMENTNDEINPNGSSKKLLRIPINTSINSYLTFFNNQPFYSTISTKVLNFLDISITDDSGKLLETNGEHYFHITFRIDFTKEKSEILEDTLITKFRKNITEEEKKTDKKN